MSRIWFSSPLETVATFWRVLRRDGVTLGFTTHDRDQWIDGVLHRATPGVVPSAIRRSADFEPDSAEVEGALSHDSLDPRDLAAGRFDGARVLIGLADWESGETQVLYRGMIGAVAQEAGNFTAELQSAKAELARDPVPRTSPSCRAAFCGPGCTLSAARFSHNSMVGGIDLVANAVTITGITPADFVGGTLAWFDGPHAGITMEVIGLAGAALVLGQPLDHSLITGQRVTLREGCDRTLQSCASRFGNAVNFQGEPFLPGNDLITRYPSPVR
jgi:uncharacterized phage protein (TIGR02218 family)